MSIAPLARILLIEDDLPLRELLQEVLGDEGYEIEVADSHHSGLVALTHEPFDLIITDSIKFTPPFGALESDELEIFQRAARQVPMVFFTGYQEAQLLNADELGFAAIWQKPKDLTELLDGIHLLLHPTPPA